MKTMRTPMSSVQWRGKTLSSHAYLPRRRATVRHKSSFYRLDIAFRKWTLHLLVYMGVGIPRSPPKKDPNEDIHLGDVFVGLADQSGVPDVVQFEHVRQYLDEKSSCWTCWTNQTAGFLNLCPQWLSVALRAKPKFMSIISGLWDWRISNILALEAI